MKKKCEKPKDYDGHNEKSPSWCPIEDQTASGLICMN